MNMMRILLALGAMVMLGACTSAKEKEAEARAEAHEAQAELIEEKTETLREYKACVKDAGTDQAALAQCEALLKAVEVLENK